MKHMSGRCYRCGEPVSRKTKGGRWYRLCDRCRDKPPDDDSLVEDLAGEPMPPMPEHPPADYDELPPVEPLPEVPRPYVEPLPPMGYGPGTATDGRGERESKDLGRDGAVSAPRAQDEDISRAKF